MDLNLREENNADYQWYKAEGSHREIGKITASHGKEAVSFGKGFSLKQKEYAKACRRITEDIYPEIIEEFEGYAEQLGLTEEDLLKHYSLGLEGGCSSVAVKTRNGMCVARNYDFFYWENRRHLIHTKPLVGISHIGMHEGLIGGRFDGMNEHGLFVSFNAAGPQPEHPQPGISFHLIIRYLLEKFKNAREAKDALMKLPVNSPKSYLIADPDDAFVLEAHMDRKEYRQIKDGYLVMTNHFVHPEMKRYQDEWPNSKARYDKIEKQAKELLANDDANIESMEKLMTDHEAPVCGHEDGLATFWSCVAELNARNLLYSLGAPCRNDFKRYFAFQV